MAYEVLTGITIKKKSYEVGEILNKNQIPKESFDWLVDQGIIIDTKDIKYQEKKLQENATVKEEEIIDDYDTEFEEVEEE